MNLHEDKVQGKWLEVKGEIQKVWGKITNDELEKTKGDMKTIQGILQQKYSDNKVALDNQLSEIYDRFDMQKDKAIESIKHVIQN